MKKTIAFAMSVMLTAATLSAQNPFLQKRYGTPYEIPPFEKFTVDNYREGMLLGMQQHKQEVMDIINNTATPDFENVIAALDKSGDLLDRVSGVWSTLNSSNSNAELQALAREMSPLSSEHSTFIYMNDALFAKVKYVLMVLPLPVLETM